MGLEITSASLDLFIVNSTPPLLHCIPDDHLKGMLTRLPPPPSRNEGKRRDAQPQFLVLWKVLISPNEFLSVGSVAVIMEAYRGGNLNARMN